MAFVNDLDDVIVDLTTGIEDILSLSLKGFSFAGKLMTWSFIGIIASIVIGITPILWIFAIPLFPVSLIGFVITIIAMIVMPIRRWIIRTRKN